MTIIPNDNIQNAFRALADPTRREILFLLSKQELTIGEVSDRFDMTRAAVKKHLNILQEGALISVQVQGRERINRFEPMGLKAASDWFEYFSQFWDQRLAALQVAVEEYEISKKSETE